MADEAEEILIYKIGRTWNANWVAARKSGGYSAVSGKNGQNFGHFSECLDKLCPRSNSGLQIFTESLILAQNERWRRG